MIKVVVVPLVKDKSDPSKTLQLVSRTAVDRITKLAEGTETIFSKLANSAPISTHPARQLVFKTSKQKNRAGKLLDKNLVMVKRSKQGDVIRPLPSRSCGSSAPLGRQ